MRHRLAGRKLGRPTPHRLAMLRNQATDLFRYERIQTTEPKAREVQRMAERIVTLAKRGDLHSRRQAYAKLFDERVVDKLFVELAHRFTERAGGYTRVVKLPPRKRDGAAMAVIELVL